MKTDSELEFESKVTDLADLILDDAKGKDRFKWEVNSLVAIVEDSAEAVVRECRVELIDAIKEALKFRIAEYLAEELGKKWN